MKTRLAALAVVLMCGAATAAFAQDQGDRHQRESGGERPGMTPGQRPTGAPAWHGPAFTPRLAPPPQARQAPAAPAPQPPAAHWSGRPDGRAGGNWGGRWGAHGGGWTPPAGPAPAYRDGRGFHYGPQGGGAPPVVDSWGGDHRDHGDHGGHGDHGDHGDRGDRGDHGEHGDHGDRGDQGDRGGWRGDWGGDRHGDGGPEHWRPGAYPQSYHSHHRYHVRPYIRPPHFYDHAWGYGEILPEAWFAPQYVIEDWWDFGLPEPPYGYDWVRVGSDALLIDDYDGRIVQVVRYLFW